MPSIFTAARRSEVSRCKGVQPLLALLLLLLLMMMMMMMVLMLRPFIALLAKLLVSAPLCILTLSNHSMRYACVLAKDVLSCSL